MMRLLENLALESPASSPEVPALEFSTHDRGNAKEVQRYIATVFRINYGAQLSEFMPLLVSLRLADRLTAALGLRGAAGGRLFCEQYLDHRVENCVEAVFGQPVQRGRILEMGNLVASNPGHAALLYTLVGAAMYEAGVDYLVFTANRAVRLSLKRSGLASVPIAAADRNRLDTTGGDWGSYYNGDPRVMLGDVGAAMKACSANPLIAGVIGLYQGSIDELVAIIQSRLT